MNVSMIRALRLVVLRNASSVSLERTGEANEQTKEKKREKVMEETMNDRKSAPWMDGGYKYPEVRSQLRSD